MTGEPTSSCAQCGLPVRTGGKRAPAHSEGPGPFCCTGCGLAWHLSSDPLSEGSGSVADESSARNRPDARLQARVALCAFLAMGVMVFSLALYGEHLPGGDSAGFDSESARALQGIYRMGALLLATPVVHLLGVPLAATVIRGRRWLSADALILLGSAAAYSMSVWNTFAEGGQVYYETATMVLVLYSLGRLLDVRAKVRARAELCLLAPDALEQATLLSADGEEQRVSAEVLRPGDRIRVRPGETVAADGSILEGGAFVDTATLTGEAQPRSVREGDLVLAGSRSVDGSFVVLVEHGVGARLRDEVQELMRAAFARPSRYVRLADRVAAGLLPIVLLAALGAGLYHGLQLGPRQGLWVALSVVLISCPCALGIATPLAFWLALGEAWRRGILVRGADVLERLAAARHLFFDKTGTLTDGEFQLESIQPGPAAGGRGADELLRLAASMEVGSEHPIGRALRRAGAEDAPLLPISDFRALPGEGIEARVEGRSLRLCRADGAPREAAPESFASASSLVRLEDEDGARMATFELSTRARVEAPCVLAAVRALGYEPSVLTGDNRGAGAALSAELDIPVESELDPAQKLARLAARRDGGSIYIGDGLNDTAALAEADVGIAVWGGSPGCMEVADVSFLVSGLEPLPGLLLLARKAVRVARLNLLWAFSYNAIGLYFAVMGRLTPILAACAMVASSALVALHSRRALSESTSSRPRAGESASPAPRSAASLAG